MTSWYYAYGTRHGTLVTATPYGRTSLADAVMAPAVAGHADGRAVLATLFDRWPGLTLAVVPVEAAGLLLGDHRGDTTFVGDGPAELAAVATYLWLITGRRLTALASIKGIECGLHARQHLSADVGQQVGRFEEVPPGTLDVRLRDFGQREQHIRLVHR
jgi:hypothetical protein